MSTAILPQEQAIDMVTLTVIAQSIKAMEPSNISLHSALDRAVAHVRAGCWWRLHGNTLTVQSASRPDDAYSCTVERCPCQAQQGVCWHRALCAAAISASTLKAAANACVPLAVAPRRARVAKPNYDVLDMARAHAAARREQDRGLTQAELEAKYNADLF